MAPFIRQILVPVALGLAAFVAFPFLVARAPVTVSPAPPSPELPRAATLPVYAPPAPTTPSSGIIENAFRSHASTLPVTGAGTVSRLLSDDNSGSRHQRFIVRLASGHTVLIAHNIDIAPRLNSLREGDTLIFAGIYEWNDKGGVVHWTHHDPSGRHASGYLQHNGQVYR